MNTQTLYIHASNSTLEQWFDLLDPFVLSQDTGVEQSGYESDMERARR